MNRKWLEYLLNLAFWVFTALLLVRSFSIVAVEHTVSNGIETREVTRDAGLSWKLMQLVALSALLFYANLYLLLSASAKRRPLMHILQALLLLVATLLIHSLLLRLPLFSGTPALPAGIVWGTIVFYFTVSVSYALVKRWVNHEIEHQHLVAAKTQAELHLLRSQLHPHFLFNVLNNLLSLVDQARNPALATAIDQLSDLLRYVIEGTSAGPVPVQEEITFLENYAELQQLRFADGEVRFELEITGEEVDQLVEPGLFIPFVENAFKYGAAPEEQTTILVHFDLRSADCIDFTVRNKLLKDFPKRENSLGTGIKKTKERLELVYPGRHWLRMESNSHFELQLKIKTDAHDHRG